MARLRIAVIGAGRLGGFHAQKIAARGDLEFVGVADPDRAARERVAKACDTRPVADYRELFGEVDAAVVAAPTHVHYDLGVALLERGIHVLMEKPLCVDAEEAEALVNLSVKREAVLQTGHVERFNPAWRHLGESVCSPKYIEGIRSSGYTFRSTDVGVVLDLMIHDIDLVLSLVGSPVRRVEALGVSVMGGFEDVASARFEFECGCVAVLRASRVSREPARRMQVWASGGFAEIDFASRTAAITRPSDTIRRREFHVDSLSPEELEYYREHLFEEHFPRETFQEQAVDALALELDDFVKSISSKREPLVSGRAGADAVAVAERVLDAIDNHAWNGVPDGFTGPYAPFGRAILPISEISQQKRRVG